MADSIKISIGGDASGLKSAVNQTNKALGNLKPGANQATFALTNLSRVAQDAPFGFIGIANNIDPLIQSFISLKRETGSTGAALKTLGSSLLGPGGLILGVGLLSTVMTLFGQGLFNTTQQVDGFAKAQKEANDEAGKEIARLKILTTVATDNTRSLTERKNAAQELSSKLKDYNVQLSEEAILNGNVAKATNQATKAILERARARAIENRIAELSGENLQREIELQEATEQLRANQEKLNKELAKTSKFAPSNVSSGEAKVLHSFSVGINQRIEELRKANAEAENEINSLLSRVKTESITPKFDIDTPKAKKDVKDQLQKLVDEFEFNIEPTIIFSPKEIAEAQRISDIINGRAQLRPDVAGATGSGQISPGAFNPFLKAINDVGEKMQKSALFAKMEEDALKLTGIINETLAPAFQSFFENIFSGGQNALQALGSAIASIIKRLAAAAATALVFAAIISSITGGGFGASFGKIFSSLSGLPKFAEGGIVTKPTLGIFGEAGAEAVMPLSKLDDMFAGTNVTLQPSIRFSGMDFQIMLERIDNKRRRLG